MDLINFDLSSFPINSEYFNLEEEMDPLLLDGMYHDNILGNFMEEDDDAEYEVDIESYNMPDSYIPPFLLGQSGGLMDPGWEMDECISAEDDIFHGLDEFNFSMMFEDDESNDINLLCGESIYPYDDFIVDVDGMESDDAFGLLQGYEKGIEVKQNIVKEEGGFEGLIKSVSSLANKTKSSTQSNNRIAKTKNSPPKPKQKPKTSKPKSKGVGGKYRPQQEVPKTESEKVMAEHSYVTKRGGKGSKLSSSVKQNLLKNQKQTPASVPEEEHTFAKFISALDQKSRSKQTLVPRKDASNTLKNAKPKLAPVPRKSNTIQDNQQKPKLAPISRKDSPISVSCTDFKPKPAPVPRKMTSILDHSKLNHEIKVIGEVIAETVEAKPKEMHTSGKTIPYMEVKSGKTIPYMEVKSGKTIPYMEVKSGKTLPYMEIKSEKTVEYLDVNKSEKDLDVKENIDSVEVCVKEEEFEIKMECKEEEEDQSTEEGVCEVEIKSEKEMSDVDNKMDSMPMSNKSENGSSPRDNSVEEPASAEESQTQFDQNENADGKKKKLSLKDYKKLMQGRAKPDSASPDQTNKPVNGDDHSYCLPVVAVPVTDAKTIQDDQISKVVPVTDAKTIQDDQKSKVVPVTDAKTIQDDQISKVVQVTDTKSIQDDQISKVVPVTDAKTIQDDQKSKVVPVTDTKSIQDDQKSKVVPVTNTKSIQDDQKSKVIDPVMPVEIRHISYKSINRDQKASKVFGGESASTGQNDRRITEIEKKYNPTNPQNLRDQRRGFESYDNFRKRKSDTHHETFVPQKKPMTTTNHQYSNNNNSWNSSVLNVFELPGRRSNKGSNSAGFPSDASSVSSSGRRSRSRSSSVSSNSSSDSSSSEGRYRRRKCSRSRSPKDRGSRKSNDHQKAIEERRIIYIGGIPSDYTKYDLERKMERFGNVLNTSIHKRNKDEYYGFVTFAKTSEAANAKQEGHRVPGCERFDFSYGGRREFCGTSYADLDHEAVCKTNSKKNLQNLNFADLLQQTLSMVQKSNRKS